jgi:methylated-DNA-[protein]-cysteine S-methyltransferase
MNLYSAEYASPFGNLIVAVDEGGALVRVVLPNEPEYWQIEIISKGYQVQQDMGRLAPVLTQLDEYFHMQRRTFDLPLRPIGTAFRLKVWAALQTIPYGVTISYKELAERIDNPNAIRAVGQANGVNPIPIVIPCHRVIGADGSLTGFGGGLELKAQLLRLEGANLPILRKAEAQLALL